MILINIITINTLINDINNIINDINIIIIIKIKTLIS